MKILQENEVRSFSSGNIHVRHQDDKTSLFTHDKGPFPTASKPHHIIKNVALMSTHNDSWRSKNTLLNDRENITAVLHHNKENYRIYDGHASIFNETRFTTDVNAGETETKSKNENSNVSKRSLLRHHHEEKLSANMKFNDNKPLLISLVPKVPNNITHLSRSSKKIDTNNKRHELPVHKRTSVQYSTLVGPSFLNVSYHNQVRALAGQTATLACIIRNLHNHTVSNLLLQFINTAKYT